MSPAKGSIPCPSCGGPVPLEHSRCSRCGTSLRHGALAELDTTPGTPLLRPARRKRISDHLIPASLAREWQEDREERRAQRDANERNRAQKGRWAAATGAALLALPFAVSSFLFMPGKWDALALFFVDLALGGVAGYVVHRLHGGALRGALVFVPAIAAAVAIPARLGMPLAGNPAAFVVVLATGGLALGVAGVIGLALDEHGLDAG